MILPALNMTLPSTTVNLHCSRA